MRRAACGSRVASVIGDDDIIESSAVLLLPLAALFGSCKVCNVDVTVVVVAVDATIDAAFIAVFVVVVVVVDVVNATTATSDDLVLAAALLLAIDLRIASSGGGARNADNTPACLPRHQQRWRIRSIDC